MRGPLNRVPLKVHMNSAARAAPYFTGTAQRRYGTRLQHMMLAVLDLLAVSEALVDLYAAGKLIALPSSCMTVVHTAYMGRVACRVPARSLPSPGLPDCLPWVPSVASLCMELFVSMQHWLTRGRSATKTARVITNSCVTVYD